jgi:predicted GTPase
MAGTTRDQIEQPASWQNVAFSLTDTAGMFGQSRIRYRNSSSNTATAHSRRLTCSCLWWTAAKGWCRPICEIANAVRRLAARHRGDQQNRRSARAPVLISTSWFEPYH